MFKTFETLAAAEASGPFAIYWHGDSEGYVSGSFLEISNFIPAGATFSLIGVHTIWGMVVNFDDKPSVMFEAPISASDAWAQVTDEWEVAEMDRRNEDEIQACHKAIIQAIELGISEEEYSGISLDEPEADDAPEYFGA
jgi:hypothetical protein